MDEVLGLSQEDIVSPGEEARVHRDVKTSALIFLFCTEGLGIKTVPHSFI